MAPPLDLDDPRLPRPPDKPDDWECCGRGCTPCILDYYEDAMARWRVAVRKLGYEPAQVLKAIGRKPG